MNPVFLRIVKLTLHKRSYSELRLNQCLVGNKPLTGAHAERLLELLKRFAVISLPAQLLCGIEVRLNFGVGSLQFGWNVVLGTLRSLLCESRGREHHH